MPEPTTVSSTTLAAIFIALFGPFAGQYALIVFASLGRGLVDVRTLPPDFAY